MDKTAWIFLAFIIAPAVSIREAASQYTMQQTYCNPVNIDYTYAIYDSHQDISYRSGADPAVVDFRNEYYMFVTDENSKTFWVAEENNDNQWLEIDLESPGEVFAIQVNYHDYRSDIYGRVPGMRHRYVIEGSADGSEWTVLVDRENSFDDVPNDYVELGKSELVRYIRFSNIEVPMQNLAISGLRVFGTGTGEKPGMVEDFRVIRHDDRRDATITWEGQDNAQGYNIRWGIAPDKLYSSWMIYDDHSHLMRSLTTRQSYYFAIEAFNENGISELSDIIRVE